MASNLSCVSFAERSLRQSFDPDDNEANDRFWVLTLEPSFQWIVYISSLCHQVICVELQIT